MATRTPWLRAIIAAACVLGGCAPAAVSPTSVPPTESPAAAVGNLPPGCEPIDLRSPSGEAVDLNGIWIQDEQGGRRPAKWWIRTLGDCIWGSGIYDDYTDDEEAGYAESVQVLQGRLRNDFVVDGAIVLLGPHPTFAVLQYLAEVRLLIEFGPAGEITLREDRTPGVQGPRCPDVVGYCPPPLVLRPRG